jgi:hypothetical protein
MCVCVGRVQVLELTSCDVLIWAGAYTQGQHEKLVLIGACVPHPACLGIRVCAAGINR